MSDGMIASPSWTSWLIMSMNPLSTVVSFPQFGASRVGLRASQMKKSQNCPMMLKKKVITSVTVVLPMNFRLSYASRPTAA
ncbi:hypothetical protein ACFOJ6_06215 [Gordonia humi]|uniref:Uncharacterized protein n=1 Tax=Gordonia humi TaxID=686429 RepID=A0A840EXX5_9ACTN|nr:hypothetical protein [Gordonia humi]